MSNPLADLVGNFVLGMTDKIVEGWLSKYVGPGKLTQSDVKDIVAGIHGDMKLGLLIKAETPTTPSA